MARVSSSGCDGGGVTTATTAAYGGESDIVEHVPTALHKLRQPAALGGTWPSMMRASAPVSGPPAAVTKRFEASRHVDRLRPAGDRQAA